MSDPTPLDRFASWILRRRGERLKTQAEGVGVAYSEVNLRSLVCAATGGQTLVIEGWQGGRQTVRIEDVPGGPRALRIEDSLPLQTGGDGDPGDAHPLDAHPIRDTPLAILPIEAYRPYRADRDTWEPKWDDDEF